MRRGAGRQWLTSDEGLCALLGLPISRSGFRAAETVGHLRPSLLPVIRGGLGSLNPHALSTSPASHVPLSHSQLSRRDLTLYPETALICITQQQYPDHDLAYHEAGHAVAALVLGHKVE